MSHSTGSPPPPPNTTPEKQALLEAYDTVLRTQADEAEARRAAARRRQSGSRLLLLVCVTIALFVCVYLYVERPEWVFPVPPTPESLIVREASLRINVANAAQHVELYRQRTGRLPATLTDAGAHESALEYEPGTTGYRLHADMDGVRLTYDSSEPLARFVGSSFKIITRRSK